MEEFEIPLPPNMSPSQRRKGTEHQTIQEEPSKDDSKALSQSPRAAGPLTKRWFREQFGLRKGCKNPKIIEPSEERPKRQAGLRRTSSLPDLASLLDAASTVKDVKVTTLFRHRSMRENRRPVSSIIAKN